MLVLFASLKAGFEPDLALGPCVEAWTAVRITSTGRSDVLCLGGRVVRGFLVGGG